MAAVQQIMDMVMQMMQSGASEEEIIAALKEMGLSDQDIALIMQAIVEQGQQQNPIDAELSQMM
jgi:NACalpha-BTF3-like transcription factor